jgi:hypothetical protein
LSKKQEQKQQVQQEQQVQRQAHRHEAYAISHRDLFLYIHFPGHSIPEIFFFSCAII